MVHVEMRVDVVKRVRQRAHRRERSAVPVGEHRLHADRPQVVPRTNRERRFAVAHEIVERPIARRMDVVDAPAPAVRRRLGLVVWIRRPLRGQPRLPLRARGILVEDAPPPREDALVHQGDERHRGIVRITQVRIRIHVGEEVFRKGLPVLEGGLVDEEESLDE